MQVLAKGEKNFLSFVIIPFWTAMNVYLDEELDMAL